MEFETFFEAVHGHRPFPWQVEAARRLNGGEPPEAVAVPTGCGKTAMLDAALYHAAHGGPRRIFFIIDRRVVVDEAYQRAEHLRQVLTDAGDGPPAEVARRLGPIQVVRLRGGVHTDENWPLYPERVTIVLSTVDQVGSRLLHRGYGVSSRMWPVHAGFVGTNALYLVDEAHLSRPFVTTVQAATGLGADIRCIRLSATPGGESGKVLTLSEADREVPVLQKRLDACKRVRLETAAAADDKFTSAVATRAVETADAHAPGAVVGVVVNQVRTARQIFERLQKRRGEAVLLTGRVRPQDRQATLDDLLPRIRAGRERDRDDSPLFVVATQTVEVGADLDFDALVTELAPLSALRQRFGRVDRLGERGSSDNLVIARDKFLQEKEAAKAPVYGADLRATWRWLEQVVAQHGAIDFGPSAMATLLDAFPAPAETEAHCPRLLPAHMERFAQTGPDAPMMDPAPWLHGPQRPYREVSVVWRADLQPDDPEHWREYVLEQPPRNGEALQLPIHLVRDILAGRKGRGDASDLEGTADSSAAGGEAELPGVLRWRGRDEAAVVEASAIVPGDTVIIPAAVGGCDRFGWAPGHRVDVQDLGDEVAIREDDGRRALSLRLHPAVDGWIPEPARSGIHSAIRDLHEAEHHFDQEEGPDEERIATAREVLQARLDGLDHPRIHQLGPAFGYRWLPDGWLVLRRDGVEETAERGTDTGTPVGLEAHSAGVAEMVERIAGGHPEQDRLVRSARGHDCGKQIHGFQVLLHGDPVRAAAGPPLAKSGLRGRRTRHTAWELSGLPRGFRHEICSLDFLDEEDAWIRHLVVTHHGYGRPWFPPYSHEAPGADEVHLKGSQAGRFGHLLRETGPWRLAELEMLLRAADIRRSMEEAGQ